MKICKFVCLYIGKGEIVVFDVLEQITLQRIGYQLNNLLVKCD